MFLFFFLEYVIKSRPRPKKKKKFKKRRRRKSFDLNVADLYFRDFFPCTFRLCSVLPLLLHHSVVLCIVDPRSQTSGSIILTPLLCWRPLIMRAKSLRLQLVRTNGSFQCRSPQGPRTKPCTSPACSWSHWMDEQCKLIPRSETVMPEAEHLYNWSEIVWHVCHHSAAGRRVN